MLGSPDNGVPVLQTPAARRRRVIMPLVILIAVGIAALLLTLTGRPSVQLQGSGSTLAQPLGSLGGLMRLSDPNVDFAVSDYPVSASELSERKLAQFPIAVGAVAVVHNLGLPEGQRIKLDAPTIAPSTPARSPSGTIPASR